MEVPKVFTLCGNMSNMLFILLAIMYIQIVHGNNVSTEVKDTVTNTTNNEVTIYTETNYWGIHWTMTISNCTDVPVLLYKKASSIDSHDNCVLLFSRQECKGRHIKIEPGTEGHAHLSDLEFDDTLASLAPCSYNFIKEAIPRKEKKPGSTRTRRQANFLGDLMGKMDTTQNDDDSDDTDSEQNGGDVLQSLLKGFNLKSIMNRLQISSDDDSA